MAALLEPTLNVFIYLLPIIYTEYRALNMRALSLFAGEYI
jgi:hypothetical protein